MVSRALYSPYGELRNGSTYPTDLGFTAQRQEGFGLMDYGARLYDPQLGRFISPDTIVPDPTNLNTLNRYAYVNNNPVNLVDPSGHSCVGAQCPPIPLSDLAKIAGPLTVSAPEAAPIAASVGAAAIMAGGAYVGSEWALQDITLRIPLGDGAGEPGQSLDKPPARDVPGGNRGDYHQGHSSISRHKHTRNRNASDRYFPCGERAENLCP